MNGAGNAGESSLAVTERGDTDTSPCCFEPFLLAARSAATPTAGSYHIPITAAIPAVCARSEAVGNGINDVRYY